MPAETSGVSRLMLGTAEWGAHVDRTTAFALLDAAVDLGIRHVDTAEVYPVPFSAETQGAAEQMIGDWRRARGSGHHDEIRISTKAAGPGPDYPWIRGAGRSIGREDLRRAVDGSRRRLGVDCIELFSVHWSPAVQDTDDQALREEAASAAGELRDEDAIRCFGLCNETAAGLDAWRLAAEAAGIRLTTLQLPYNLLTGTPPGVGETLAVAKAGLVGYSPLAHGVLTGKYIESGPAPGDRLHRHPFLQRYRQGWTADAVTAFRQLAQTHDMSLAELALGYVTYHPDVARVIVGSTSVAQLAETVRVASRPPASGIWSEIAKIQAEFGIT